MASEYSKTGVDAGKKGIEVFETYIKNIFPGAFCVVTQDPDFSDRGLITHSDGAGSKTITNYLLAKEHGDNRYFETVAQDVLAMNIDDTDCVNSKPLSFVDYVAINKFTVPKEEFLRSLNNGFGKCLDMLKRLEIPLPFGGGETADLPDQVRTVDVSGTIISRVKLSGAITGRKIEPGNYIVGLESGGRANYENKENSGIMCNGLTLARHCLTHHSYEEKYPEIRDAKGRPYTGKFKLDQSLNDVGMTLGEALISPTKIFSPITKKILDRHRDDITGVVHDTGGGSTKILKLGKNVHYIKSNQPKPYPIFYLIQKESGESWWDMHKDFNCGIGMEYIVNSLDVAEDIQSIAESYGVGSVLLGNIRKSDGSNKLTVHTEFGKLNYP